MALSTEKEQSSMRHIHFQVSMNPSFEGGLLSGLPEVKDPFTPLEIEDHRNVSGERGREIRSENPERRLNMVAYVFYLKDGCEEDSLIGVLTERRGDKRRVTPKSIMRWGKLAAGSNVNPNSIYYVKLDL